MLNRDMEFPFNAVVLGDRRDTINSTVRTHINWLLKRREEVVKNARVSRGALSFGGSSDE
jgi:hypothetical protein